MCIGVAWRAGARVLEGEWSGRTHHGHRLPLPTGQKFYFFVGRVTHATRAGLAQDMAWYEDLDGELYPVKLLVKFQAFFREHSEH